VQLEIQKLKQQNNKCSQHHQNSQWNSHVNINLSYKHNESLVYETLHLLTTFFALQNLAKCFTYLLLKDRHPSYVQQQFLHYALRDQISILPIQEFACPSSIMDYMFGNMCI
jgi:hypothetical protein